MHDKMSTAGGVQADRYFISLSGDLQGPFTFQQLQLKRQPGQALVWHVGQPDWQPFKPADFNASRPERFDFPVTSVIVGTKDVKGPTQADISTGQKSSPDLTGTPLESFKKVGAGVGSLILFVLVKLLIFKTHWSELPRLWSGSDDSSRDRPVAQAGSTGNTAPNNAPAGGLARWPVSATHQPPVATQSQQVQTKQAAVPATPAGLARGELRLASALVITSWLTWPKAENAVSGSAVPFAELQDGRLALMTNQHVLDAEALMAAKTQQGLFVGRYEIVVKLPSGRVCQVQTIRPESTSVDLAVLYVDRRDLRAGVDYVIAPVLPATTPLEAGDEVVAVGNPGLGDGVLEGSQTFGHVSALRDDVVNGVTTKYIQTDCALNHGNSGGPLFVKVGDRHYWAGINTAAAAPDQGYQGLNFAIDARQAMSLLYCEFAANPNGVTSYLEQNFHFTASTFTP